MWPNESHKPKGFFHLNIISEEVFFFFFFLARFIIVKQWWIPLTRTGENEIQQHGAFPVPDAAHGRKVKVQHEEKDAAKETGHAHRDAVVAGVRVVVEDAEQTLAADVDVAFVHDAAEHHDGENLQGWTSSELSYGLIW